MALDLAKFTIDSSGNIRQNAAFVPGTDARFTTLELHAALQDLADNATPSGDDNVSILGTNPSELAGKRNASRPMALTLLPNYNNGGSEAWDGGPFEFDHGYGNHPATATISLSNIVSGSRVLITRDDTSAVLYNDVPGASLSLSTGYIGNFSVVIRKASESPFYREFSAGGTTVANQTTSIKALQQLDE